MHLLIFLINNLRLIATQFYMRIIFDMEFTTKLVFLF